MNESVPSRRDEVQRQLEEDLADAHLLQEISSALIDEQAVQGLYERLLEVASRVMRSDFASMQRFEGDSGLELLASRGFPAAAAQHWRWVESTSTSICGMTLRTKSRVIAADVECFPGIDATEMSVFRNSGIRAVQSTPLLSRNGALLGVMSTHWKQPWQPPERQLRLLDVIARQAADLIERTSAQEAQRVRAKRLVEADRRKD